MSLKSRPLFILVCMLIIAATGCQGKSPFVEKKEEEKTSVQRAAEILVDRNGDKLALLSKKYGLDPAKTRSIIVDYRTFILSPSPERYPQQRVHNQLEMLDGLSKKYEVSVDRVASLLLDYENGAEKL